MNFDQPEHADDDEPQHNEPPSEGDIELAAAASAPSASEDTEPDEGAAPAGSGTLGIGSQLQVNSGGRRRPLQDGAGLCSLGTWEPEARPPCRAHAIVALRAAILRQLRNLEAAVGRSLRDIFSRLAAREMEGSPFPTELTQDLQRYALHLLGPLAHPRHGDREGPINVRMLQRLLIEVGDPDAGFIDQIATGVPIGVGVRLPRTPAVFPRKRKWAMSRQHDAELWKSPWVASPWRDNYPSAQAELAEVRNQLEELVRSGKALKLDPAELQRRWPDAAVASLGVLVKSLPDGSRKLRLLYDGTYGVDVNPRIRVRDQIRGPCTADVKRVLRAQSARPRPTVGLTVDVADAHRLVPVREDDWKFQVCRAERGGDLFVFKSGLFGIASAAYWWGRLAGSVVRLIHHVALPSMELWLLLVADDLKLESTAPDPHETLLLVLWLLEVLNLPLQWNKSEGGASLNWVGYQFTYSSHSLGLSESRAAWAAAWCNKLARAGFTRLSEFREGLGRLGFVVGALAFDAPFLSPLYSYAAVCSDNRSRVLPVYVRITLAFLAERIARRRSYSCAQAGPPSSLGPRVDAMADKDRIGVGGWLPTRDEHGQISTEISPWFAVVLDRNNASWAYCRDGQPFRVIAALEAFGTLLAVRAFRPWLQGSGRGCLTLKAFTDNKGNSFALNRLSTTKFPLNVVVMELAIVLEELALLLDLRWVPRELNEEADRLSNGVTTGFSSKHRIRIEASDLTWPSLEQRMSLGEDFHRENNRLRGCGMFKAARIAKRRRGDRLRDREPW